MADQSENETPARGPSWIDRFGAIGVAFLTLTAASLFFSGKQYEDAYASEWGMPDSALSYSPYELMSTSGRLLAPAYFAAVLIAILLWLRTDLKSGAPQTKRQIWLRWGFGIVAAGFDVVLFADGIIEHDASTIILALTMAAIGVGAILGWAAQRGDAEASRLLVAVFAVFILGYLLVVPPILGRYQATWERGHLVRLPLVELTRIDGTLQHIGTDCGPVTRWRVVRVNDGHYFLVADQKGAREVTEINTTDVASARYLVQSQQPGTCP